MKVMTMFAAMTMVTVTYMHCAYRDHDYAERLQEWWSNWTPTKSTRNQLHVG